MTTSPRMLSARRSGSRSITIPTAVGILLDWFKQIGREPNEARMRMARMPKGATLIDNPVSKAPGFQINNVFVMAGIPKVMHAMMDFSRAKPGARHPGREPARSPCLAGKAISPSR